MKIYSFAASALALCALTAVASGQGVNALKRVQPQVLGDADSDAITHFNMYLPLTHKAELQTLLSEQTDPSSKNYHHWLTPAQFKTQFGANPADVAKVKAALSAAGMTVVAEHTQSLEIEAPAWAVQRTFATRLQRVAMTKGREKFASAERHLTLPDVYKSAGVIIPEFLPQLQSHVHSHKMAKAIDVRNPDFRLSNTESLYYPNDMNEAYDFPSFRAVSPGKPGQLVGQGSTIGIVISSVVSHLDLLNTFQSTLNLGGGRVLAQEYKTYSNLPYPSYRVNRVGTGSGAFDPNDDAAFEASLDTQMSLGTAPGASEVLYDIADLSDDSIIAGYAKVDDDNEVDVVSSSFGECELYYTAAFNDGYDYTPILQIYHALFQQGNAQGITYIASSGDNGAQECIPASFFDNPTNTNYITGVSSPADDPSVTAVGGTNLITVPGPTVDDANYSVENANYDPRLPVQIDLGGGDIVSIGNNTWGSGGGFSQIYARPSYQAFVPTGSAIARAVPDVSLQMGGCPGDADLAKQDCRFLPRSATLVWLGGDLYGAIGTSSSAPQFAGVMARLVQLNGGRVGNINPYLYQLSALQGPSGIQYYHRNITGDNNGYKVKPGDIFSEVLGNGTLDVRKFLLTPTLPATGTPNTISNP